MSYRVFTHDLRSPIRRGTPIWDGTCPYYLPRVDVDLSDKPDGAGWAHHESAKGALLCSGLWPDGRPSRLFECEPLGTTATRGQISRSESLRIVRECGEVEIGEAVLELSVVFGEHVDDLATEQMLWRAALAQPRREVIEVERGLRAALKARQLAGWTLRQYSDPSSLLHDARSTVSRPGRDAWFNWSATVEWSVYAHFRAHDAGAAWSVKSGVNPYEDSSAWDAKDALELFYTSRCGWTSTPAYRLTIGMRDAYESGLGLACPVAPTILGWSLSP